MPGNRKLSLIAVLLLTTLLWGTGVAIHHHPDAGGQHCQICLLPHTGSTPHLDIPVPARVGTRHEVVITIPSTALIFTYQYRARGPPAFSG